MWAILISLPIYAKLPAPGPEELAKKQAAAEKKAQDEEAAKEALGHAQDRVAQQYRARHPNAPQPVPLAAPAAVKK